MDQVVEVLREMLLSGHFRPGDHIPQEKLAGELGVSRTPLREALLKLQEEGLVRLSRTRGVEVTKLDASELLELCDVREAVEGLAARLASQSITPAEARAAKSILGKMARLVEKPVLHDWLVTNRDFHRCIIQASHNRFLVQLLPYIMGSGQMIFRLLVTSPGEPERTYREHLAVYESVVAGDPEAAECAARAHIAGNRVAIRQLRNTQLMGT